MAALEAGMEYNLALSSPTFEGFLAATALLLVASTLFFHLQYCAFHAGFALCFRVA